MRFATIRGTVAAGMAAALLTSWVAPAGAQTTIETRISYAATADATGLAIRLASDPTVDPEIEIGGAETHAEIDSTPEASGFGQVTLGEDDTRAATSAPPDDTENASGAGLAPTALGPLTVALADGDASSASEVNDDEPATENDASFGLLEADLSLGIPILPDPLAAGLSVAGLATSADAGATSATDIEARATSDGVLISLVVEAVPAAVKDPICQALAQLGVTPCPLDSLAPGGQELATIEITQGEAVCSWDGDDPAADGTAPTAIVTIDGLDPIVIDEGQEFTVPGTEGTPLETTLRAGTLSLDEQPAGEGETDEVTAQATGAQLSAFEGRVAVDFATAECGLSGRVTTREIIARTGGEVLPLLFGGSAMAVAGLGLRRFLKRR